MTKTVLQGSQADWLPLVGRLNFLRTTKIISFVIHCARACRSFSLAKSEPVLNAC
jgi:hypothetical protein